MSLEAWQDAGLITTHTTDRQEISDLLAIVDTDLKDAEIPELSAERKLSCCYNAMLTAARAALRASGYRFPRAIRVITTMQSNPFVTPWNSMLTLC